MQQRDNKNRGGLWANDKKTESKHPDYRGQLDVDGVKYWVSCWVADGSNPKAPVLSLSVKKADDAPAQARSIGAMPVTPHNQAKADGFQTQADGVTDDVPF